MNNPHNDSESHEIFHEEDHDNLDYKRDNNPPMGSGGLPELHEVDDTPMASGSTSSNNTGKSEGPEFR
jgi:hypothetical protein